jgi:DNA-binding PadR family transcriptional regulator
VVKAKKDILQGTLVLMVLRTLVREPMHGYGITLHIQTVSENLLRVEEGSLYPALQSRKAGSARSGAPRGTIAAPATTG